jgi:hypothetical protein
MISVVCVYNNEAILKNVLLKSLKSQTVPFDLITLDNTDSKFKSAAAAYNHGGGTAKGDYIMFVHQDMWLANGAFLEDAEKMLSFLPNLGIAGVAGHSDKGGNWWERARYSIGTFDETARGMGYVQRTEEVQTLDECLLIVPRAVFEKLKFDEKTFDGWDCYGADYCLSATQLGLKAYVIPMNCNHCCLRSSYEPWKFKDLLKYQKRLYEKHKRNYRRIYTWIGDISWLHLRLYELRSVLGPVYLRLFPKVNDILKTELADCESVLDLGCGPESGLSQCAIPFSVGVELYEPWLIESQGKSIHSQYILADIRRIDFKPKSFDAVLAIEVLEHLTKQEGCELIRNMEGWAKKKIIVTTPNGYVKKQTPSEGNLLQEHKSGWRSGELRQLGFKVRGIEGWKRLRGYQGVVKYKPAFVWGRISDLTQKITYYYPSLAFRLLAVKRTKEAHRN